MRKLIAVNKIIKMTFDHTYIVVNFYCWKKRLVVSDFCFNLCSSSCLYFKLADLFILLSLSKVIGSTISEDNCLTLLKATYVMPSVCSDFPISTHAWGKVNPWLLWIVSAHASLSGSCCLSWTELPEYTEIVTGAIGTKEGILLDMEGPI